MRSILLNFAHPITTEQQAQVEALAGVQVEQVINQPIQFEQDKPFLPQLRQVVEAVPLSPKEWQTAPIIINLPALAPIAALTLAELHGRMGYFPFVLRLKPVPGAVPPRFEVAEILNLQAVRDEARKKR
jgi:hypothetical protein